MGTRSDIIAQLSNGKWKRIYCHWDGYLSHNGKILFDHYTDQKHVDALMALGNLSSLRESVGVKHPFDAPPMCKPGSTAWEDNPAYTRFKKKYGNMCTAYIRDRGMGNWHYAKTKAEFLESESGTTGDNLHAVWPEEDCATEFTYVWDGQKWWVGDPDEGAQTLIDLGDALSGKQAITPKVKAFGVNFVIGKHLPHDPTEPDDHTWSSK